jgi:hypothetical protein
MPHDSTAQQPPSAAIAIGDLFEFALLGTPVAAEAVIPGACGVILGFTGGGHPVILGITALEWLRDLADAVGTAQARGVVQAGMTAVLTP